MYKCKITIECFSLSSQACDRLLAHRVDMKLKSRKVNDVLNRLHVAQPQKRDERVRAPYIPEGVLQRLESMKMLFHILHV